MTMPKRKHEITIMAANNHGQMVLIDRATIDAIDAPAAAQEYARLFTGSRGYTGHDFEDEPDGRRP
jgi:hypothetical protein